VGRQLRARTLFAERKEGVMMLRRGFHIAKDEKVLVCEDVVTTGGSVSEVIALVRKSGGIVSGVAFIVDRSAGKVQFEMGPGGLQYSLMAMDVVAYPPAECPLCAKGLPVVKPGSRGNA
jgi:orotate phosphoribosyltransferase